MHWRQLKSYQINIQLVAVMQLLAGPAKRGLCRPRQKFVCQLNTQKDWAEPDTLQSVRTYCLEETLICLTEAISEVRALFKIIFLTSLSPFASSFPAEPIGVNLSPYGQFSL